MKKQFLDILKSVKREGIENLIKFLEESSFFEDPATTDSYNSCSEGLLQHSLNVYQNLNKYISCFSNPLYPVLKGSEDSIKIIGLLHDVSLTGLFQKTTKNTPLKGNDGKNKRKEDGRLVFVEKESYDFLYDQSEPYPQGQASTVILKRYIKLTKLEDLAIQWHHGFFDIPNNQVGLLNRVQKMHLLILLTHFADRQAQLYESFSIKPL